MSFLIKPLSPELIEDYLFFFDHMVFSENPDWSRCYCYSYHFTGASEEWTKETNRDAVIKLISENRMRGYLAFDGDKPVGWCNANNKNNFQAFTDQDYSQKDVCAIVCFLISPDYRRRGISQQLLERVCNDYTRERGYAMIEAYPRKDKPSCEGNYHGHLSLYEKFSFGVEEEFDDHYVVRKLL